jgi:hypothetical protein
MCRPPCQHPLTLGSLTRAESGWGSRSLLMSTSFAAAMSASVLQEEGEVSKGKSEPRRV